MGISSPLSPAKRFLAAITAILVLVSILALAIWGAKITLSNSVRPGHEDLPPYHTRQQSSRAFCGSLRVIYTFGLSIIKPPVVSELVP